MRNRASADDIVRLRVEFSVARALDTLNAIPGPITPTEQSSLHMAVDAHLAVARPPDRKHR